jgi:phosphoribosylaminoimidazole-succinocarboxamide synthase
MENNFQGLTGQTVPEMPDEFVQEVTDRYIELYENITGEKFERVDYSNVLKRIEDNVTSFLKSV